jgi:hypothetical protein
VDSAFTPLTNELLEPKLRSEETVDAHSRKQSLRRKTLMPRNPEHEKDFSGRLPFRSDPATHRKIAIAAERENKSINAWMEEVLSEAADDVLGQEKAEINSVAIQQLIEDSDYAVKLIEDIAAYLKEWSPPFVLRFNAALKQLLIGLDAVSPFLRNEETGLSPDSVRHLLEKPNTAVAKLTFALLPSAQGEDRLFFRQFSTALKKFLLGLAAVKPFLKEDQTDSALQIIATIGALLEEIESKSSYKEYPLKDKENSSSTPTP